MMNSLECIEKSKIRSPRKFKIHIKPPLNISITSQSLLLKPWIPYSYNNLKQKYLRKIYIQKNLNNEKNLIM